MNKKLGVLIVEDDDATRRNIQAKVASHPGLHVLAEAETLATAVAAYERCLPDVILVDLELPDGSGVELITQCANRAHILVISVFGDETRVIEAIKAGAQGYLLKDDDANEITNAIFQLVDGGSPISPSIARHLISAFTSTQVPKSSSDVKLSERELEVLSMAAKGFTYAEIAALLEVSTNTIASYTKRIYTKLTVNSKSEAVYEARKLGLMDE